MIDLRHLIREWAIECALIVGIVVLYTSGPVIVAALLWYAAMGGAL